MNIYGEQRRISMRYYGSIIENIENRLLNKNAQLSDSFIAGSDRAKLIEIEKTKKKLFCEIEYIQQQYIKNK